MVTMVRKTAKSLMVERTYKEKTCVKFCFFTIIICMCRKTILSPIKNEVFLYYTTPLNIIYFFLVTLKFKMPTSIVRSCRRQVFRTTVHSFKSGLLPKEKLLQTTPHHLSLPSIPLGGLAITAILGTLGQ